jgi:NADP-dependent aldehyde dehydrogenase
MSVQPVLIAGEWRPSQGTETFAAANPSTCEPLPESYPVSPYSEIDQAVVAAAEASRQMRGWPGARFAAFLERFAERIEARKAEFVARAHQETGLPAETRLAGNEFPRTVNQLRSAAAAARQSSWCVPTIDTKANIRSMYGPLGPVAVFGPNNFPFAFNSAAGGDFAAAIAAGNPVIAKGHPSHPGTTRMFAEEAREAARDTDMPPALVQLIYRTSHADGAKLVSHHLLGASGYTGSRHAGLALKQAADQAGKPIYLELSSINPVFVLPGALAERSDKVAEEFTTSCLMGAGQMCTNPGFVVLVAGPETEAFIQATVGRFNAAPVSTMLGQAVEKSLTESVGGLQKTGAQLLTGGERGGGKGYCYRNTLLRVSGDAFLQHPEGLQAEAFGNSSLLVVARDADQMMKITDHLEGNLCGVVYSALDGRDDALANRVSAALRPKVGRLLNDKMPTGVAVTAAMNHGGPYPATGHPGFTAVGIPASLLRFGALQCYDNVREARLPAELRNKNPGGLWRNIDGQWTTADVAQ